jgi:hypothetical protein
LDDAQISSYHAKIYPEGEEEYLHRCGQPEKYPGFGIAVSLPIGIIEQMVQRMNCLKNLPFLRQYRGVLKHSSSK